MFSEVAVLAAHMYGVTSYKGQKLETLQKSVLPNNSAACIQVSNSY